MRMASEIEAAGAIAIIRVDDLSAAVDLTRALLEGGVSAVEFTFTNRRAAQAIEEVKKSALGGGAPHAVPLLVGAGTVLDPETARTAILAGADFVVTPTLNVRTIELCRRYAVPSVVGALTPTEILTGWEAGASFVKVFPASIAGPRYIRDVLGPLPQVRLVPTGGVTIENAADFIRAGAAAVALGSNLVDARTVAAANWPVLSERAATLVRAVREARLG